jgi:hypothetical protein
MSAILETVGFRVFSGSNTVIDHRNGQKVLLFNGYYVGQFVELEGEGYYNIFLTDQTYRIDPNSLMCQTRLRFQQNRAFEFVDEAD